MYVETENLIHSNQSGFRKGHGTQSALLKIYDDISKNLDKKEVTYMILLDFSKAFDTVSHSILLQKLEHNFDFDRPAVNLFKSYLENRYQCVFLNGIYSEFKPISSGVPQGSILSPLLFSLYINELPNVIKYCNIHLFADDVQIYLSAKEDQVQSLQDRLTTDLSRISEWAKVNLLALNTQKSILLPIYRLRGRYFSPQLFLDGQSLVLSSSARNLGLIFDTKFEWKDHILHICAKIYGILKTIKPVASDLPVFVKLMLVKALVLPLISYCDVIYCSATQDTLNNLRVAINSCIRFIYSLSPFEHITPYHKLFLGCTFENFFKYKINILMHKVYNLNIPLYISEKFDRSNSRRRQDFIIPRANTSHYARSTIVVGPKCWNSLPISLKSIRSESLFRRKCLEHNNSQ